MITVPRPARPRAARNGAAVLLLGAAMLALAPTGPAAASTTDAAFNSSTGVLNVDYAAYLSKHDIVYNSPTTNPLYGLTVGNGRTGAMVWNAVASRFEALPSRSIAAASSLATFSSSSDSRICDVTISESCGSCSAASICITTCGSRSVTADARFVMTSGSRSGFITDAMLAR